METIQLKVGDRFQQAWRGVQKPLLFIVLDINREKNWIKVKCISPDGCNHIEEWDDLDVTEMAFITGGYKMIDV